MSELEKMSWFMNPQRRVVDVEPRRPSGGTIRMRWYAHERRPAPRWAREQLEAAGMLFVADLVVAS